MRIPSTAASAIWVGGALDMLARRTAVSSLQLVPLLRDPNMENEYGLVCSLNPTFPSRGSRQSGWISKDHFALDQGPVILMIENYRSGLIWRCMRSCSYS